MRTVIALLIAAFGICSAQEIRGTLLGTILDESGAVVPGAKVTVVNQATNVATETESNDTGRYVAPFLPPGTYTIRAELKGFATVNREGVVLQTQDRLSVDLVLKTGSINESVTVTAESPMLQTASADFGQVVDRSFVTRMPIMGVSPLGLADMAPGVVPTNPDGNTINYTSSNIQINGSSGTGNQMTIDGAPAEVPRMSGVTYVMPMADMVEEMKVVTAMFDAAQGRTNGGSILVSTKAGTNEFHGVGYFHFRDERFNANSWTNNSRAVARGQQNYANMGGMIGGPIAKNRTFFTAGIEKERNNGTINYNFRVPTVLERQGDFSQTLNNLNQPLQIYDPLTTLLDGTGRFVSRQQFAGGKIPSSRLNPIGEAVANQYPLPNYINLPNALGQVNYLTSVNSKGPVQNFQSRIDHVLTGKHRLYGRWATNDNTSNLFDRAPIPGYYASSNANRDERWAKHFVVEDTMTLSATLVASLRLGFNRFRQQTSGFGDKEDPDSLKLTPELKANILGAVEAGRGWPQITINDGSVPGIGPLYREAVNNMFTVTNTFSKFNGKHNLRWGLDYRNLRWFENSPGAAQNGQFTFDKNLTRATDTSASNNTSGSGLASLLLGLPTGGSIARNPALAVQNHYTGLFLQDDYRISPKLTLSFGLRYDLETPMTDRYNQFVYGFNPFADLGLTAPGLGALTGGLEFAGVNGRSRRQGKLDADNLGPRMSAAYQLNDKTVVRAGWGLFYEGLSNNLSGTAPAGAPTFTFNTPYVGSADGYRSPLAGVGLSNAFPNGYQSITGSSAGYQSLLGGSVSFYDPDRQLPSIHQMQVSVQRSLGWQSLVEIAYVGVRYNSLYRDYNLNDIPDEYRKLDGSVPNPFYGVLPASSSRGSASTITEGATKVAFPQFTSVNQQLTNGPWGRYHGMQARWEKRMSHGLQFVANYTFSKNMYFDPQSLVNDRFYKSVTDTDRTHVARMFVTADLPFGHQRFWGGDMPRWLDTMVGGWGMTWVTRYTSGAALGLTGPIGRPYPLPGLRTNASYRDCLGDPTGAMHSSPCLDVNKTQALLDRYDITPEPSRYGWLRGPGYADHDAVLFKSFRLVERVKFELRAETNNILNTPQLANPRVAIDNPRTFGTINSAGNPRSVRFTGRLTF